MIHLNSALFNGRSVAGNQESQLPLVRLAATRFWLEQFRLFRGVLRCLQIFVLGSFVRSGLQICSYASSSRTVNLSDRHFNAICQNPNMSN